MKLKLLLLLIAISNVLWAQKYDSLIITEVRGLEEGSSSNCYVEITNMGNTPIDLLEITFAVFSEQSEGYAVGDTVLDPHSEGHMERSFKLWPEASKVLEPDSSFVMAIAHDFVWTLQNMREPGYGYARPGMRSIYPYADFLAHNEEKNEIELERFPHIKDSTAVGPDSIYWHEQYGSKVTRTINSLGNAQNGWFLTHKWNATDSASIDQVKNMFDADDGSNTSTSWPVAGINDATTTCLLFRKYTIKKGELQFSLRGGGSTGLDDSDWIPIRWPEGADNWRDVWWTIGNHGDYKLDENTLEPQEGTGVTVDYAGKTITVPWGTRRLDDIMRKMKWKPGVAWVYELNGNVEDSLYRSAQEGDRLAINVVGTTLYTDTFDIIVTDPLPGDNMVIPIDHKREDPGPVTNNTQEGMLNWPRVTTNDSGTDTITGGGYGLPSGLRIDSLLKYLEKAPEASWEIVFGGDGTKRADLRNGDILKVTAEDASIKEYFLEVQAFVPNYNANLSSITWPDITLSPIQKYLYGWIGDTIPNFGPNTTGYRLFLPADHVGIPSLVAKTQDPNATISIKRANSFDGSVEDRTTVFTVTSEGGDTVQQVYSVEFVKEIDPTLMPANHMLPIISESVHKINKSSYVEIANVGNREMDLSGYMIAVAQGLDPTAAVTRETSADIEDWKDRYNKYVPGRKWVDSTQWKITPSILLEDLNVNAKVQPGDVFVMGEIVFDDHVQESDGYNADGDWPIPGKLDVQFMNSQSEWHEDSDSLPYYTNPWGEPLDEGQVPIQNGWEEDLFLFKIVNDTVRDGGKPANDPNDFELIEYMGNEEGRWYVAGIKQLQRMLYIRKPEIIRPNKFIPSDAPEGSFGSDPENSEWLVRGTEYFNSLNLSISRECYLESFLGTHFYNKPTFYVPTVKAKIYKISKGYSDSETAEGILTGTTVQEFLGNLYKADMGQVLKVIANADGSELGPDDELSNNDKLIVVAADSAWINQDLSQKTLYEAKYTLSISDQGLSADAVLTSTVYDIPPPSETTGTVAGMEYGTTIKDIIDNVTVPEGATLTVLDEQGLYVPLIRMNFGGKYADATADYNVYFEVVAENTVTTILYQLQPVAPEGVVFVTSDVYDVSQDNLLIKFIPNNTNTRSFLSNLLPSAGATLKVIDKTGFERTEGIISLDDRLVVTSSDGQLTTTYFLALMDEEFVETTIYLAYITSDVYWIDQVSYIVSGVGESTSVTDFLANITPVEGATAKVVDLSGNDKVSGNITEDDKVKVTSANEEITVVYTFKVVTETGTQPSHFSNIQLYPNPTNADIYINGIEPGSRIQVYNSLGAKVIDVYSPDQQQIISLNKEAAGLYLIYISLEDVLLGRYKAIKK